MFQFEHYIYSMGANESLQRVRRRISFVNLENESMCYYPAERNPTSDEMCLFVKNIPSCSYFVQYVDFLKLVFCTFHLNWSVFYCIIVAFLLLAFYSCIYILVKYFCLPNFIMLMELLPISSYAYSFAYCGAWFFMPVYISCWLSCPYKAVAQASLVFAKLIGDILRYFVTGIMMLCLYGHHVHSVLWWNNMAFILIGVVYVIWIVSHKYNMFGNPYLAYEDSHLLHFNAITTLFIFILLVFLVVLISYHKRQRQLRELKQTNSEIIHDIYQNSEVPSDLEITGAALTRDDLSKFQIWARAVNGYANMKERYMCLTIIFTPFYFLLANIIPVLDKTRPMNGWCKPVVCISFLIFPILFIKFNLVTMTLYIICSWVISFFVYISFHTLREPSVVWLCAFSAVGTIFCSICMQTLFSEINNLTWQYLSMQLKSCPNLICIVLLSSGEVVATVVMLIYLMRAKMLSAAYGAVMSLPTYAIYTALPLISLHKCYNKHTYVLSSSATITCYIFLLVIFLGTLFHVSMSGNKFRMSLFVYLAILYLAYLTFQFLTYKHAVHPFGALHSIRPPQDTRNRWA